MKIILKIIAFLSVISFISCNPMKMMTDEIKTAGYIPYSTPLQYAGPGTLIGGKPKRLSLVTGPETCFPKEIDGVKTNLRKYDKTTLPARQKRVTVQGKASVDLINALSTGNAMFKIGAKFNKVQTVALTMKGIHIEYLDAVELSKFYNNVMSNTCKEFLDKVGFIIQAMKVDELDFKFYDKSGGEFKIDLNNIQQILDIEASVQFSIENQVTLSIKTPKYIGYQLGRLIKEDGGIALHRASNVKWGKYNFESLYLFNEPENKRNSIFKRQMDEPNRNQFKRVKRRDYIDNNARY